MPNLNPTQQQIVNNLVKIFNKVKTDHVSNIQANQEAWQQAYDKFEQDEENFTFEEFEQICMHYGWA